MNTKQKTVLNKTYVHLSKSYKLFKANIFEMEAVGFVLNETDDPEKDGILDCLENIQDEISGMMAVIKMGT